MKSLLPFTIIILLLTGCKEQTENESARESTTTDDLVTTQIAMANGFNNFEDVQQLNFTFNVKVNDTLRSQRSWVWYPEENRVELTEGGETKTYINDGDLDEAEEAIDQKFINDTYWLLFPYQLVWSDYEFEHDRSAVAPISGDQMEKISIKYPSNGGYTPGDTYHLYLTPDDSLIKEWTYESSSGRSLSTTWEDYETFNGITIAKMHKSPDESFQLFFTDIQVITQEEQ
jgi:hypothetical protein